MNNRVAPVAELPPYPGMPRWVKLSAIIVGALVVLILLAIVLEIGGRHGPNRHMPSTGEGGNAQAKQQQGSR